MSEYSSLLELGEQRTLAKKDGIARAYDLHDQYTKSIDLWDQVLKNDGNKVLLWKSLETLLLRSRTSKWKNSSLPPTKEIREQLGMPGPGGQTIDQRIAGDIKWEDDSPSKYTMYGRALDSHLDSMERHARQLWSYVFQGRKDLVEPTNRLEPRNRSFLLGFAELNYKSQLRVAVRMTNRLHRSRMGKQLLADLAFRPPFNFLKFFGDPSSGPSADESLVKAMDSEYLKQDRFKLEKTPVLDNLITLANRLVTGLVYRLKRNADDAPTRDEVLRAFGTILYPFLDGETIFGEHSSGSSQTVLEDLKSGAFELGDLNTLVPAIVGKAEGIVSKADLETNWDSGSAPKWMGRLKGLAATWTAGLSAADTIEKIRTDSYDGTAMFKDMVTVYKTLVDTTLAEQMLKKSPKVTSEVLETWLRDALGIPADIYDMVMNFMKAHDAYDRNDISMAVGFGVAGVGAMSSMVITGLGVAGTLSGVGLWVPFAISLVLQVGGVSVALFSEDSDLLKWVKRCYWGINYKQDTAEPSDLDFGFDVSGDDKATGFARQVGKFNDFRTKVDVKSLEVENYDGQYESVAEFELANFSEESVSAFVVRPIVKDDSGEYKIRPIQHVISFDPLNSFSRGTVDFYLQKYTSDDETSKYLRIEEDSSSGSTSVKDVLGIGVGTLDPPSEHYLEVGLVPIKLENKLAKAMGDVIKPSSRPDVTIDDLPYDRLPIMVRKRKRIRVQ